MLARDEVERWALDSRPKRNYLREANEQMHAIFDKRAVEQRMHFVAMLYLYQKKA